MVLIIFWYKNTIQILFDFNAHLRQKNCAHTTQILKLDMNWIHQTKSESKIYITIQYTWKEPDLGTFIRAKSSLILFNTFHTHNWKLQFFYNVNWSLQTCLHSWTIKCILMLFTSIIKFKAILDVFGGLEHHFP